MTITEWLAHARERLAQTGCPDPDVDARWIAEDALGMTRQDMVFQGDRAIPLEQLYTLESMLDRRAAGEPVQYILGSADFMGLRFRVDNSVLIPRQDTETLVETALIELRQRPGSQAVLDLCAGSGCVGMSLLSLAPNARVVLADISPKALDIARANMIPLCVRAELCQGDLFDAVPGRRFDVIVSNPPYIPTGELATLQREVRFEPRIALDGGEDGLDFYRRIAEGAGDHLNPGGAIFLEVGINEGPAVLALLKEHLPCVQAGTVKDLCGVDRVVFAKTRNEE